MHSYLEEDTMKSKIKSYFEHDSDFVFQLFCTESVTKILFLLARESMCSSTIILF